MEYKKYEILPYQLHVIQTKRFKTVTIKVNFKRLVVKEEVTIRNMLNDILLESTKQYQTHRELALETENLYGLSCYSKTYASGSYAIMSFNLSFLNEEYTETGMMDASIQFLMELLCHPNEENKKFNQHAFDVCKEALKAQIESVEENPSFYAQLRMREEMAPDSPISNTPFGTLEDLEKITPESLYEYYLSVMRSDIVDIFFCGNVDGEKIKEFLLKNFSVNTIKKIGTSHIIKHDKFRKRVNTVVEQKDTNQSTLVIGCKFDGLTEFERKYVAGFYNHILGGSSTSLLFQTVREKHSLCYNVNSQFSGLENLIWITAGIDKKDFKKTVELIKKEMKSLQVAEVTEKQIEEYITYYLSACKQVMDDPYDIISLYVAQVYLGNDTLEEKERSILKLTKEMITTISNKIKMDTIYLLEGGNVDEKDTSTES